MFLFVGTIAMCEHGTRFVTVEKVLKKCIAKAHRAADCPAFALAIAIRTSDRTSERGARTHINSDVATCTAAQRQRAAAFVGAIMDGALPLASSC